MASLELLCAETCPESVPVAPVDKYLLSDSRILQRLLHLEQGSQMCFDYLADGSHQTELQPYMRRVVTTWMLEVCEEQCCEEQVFPLAVRLLDRFLCVSAVKRCHLQLLACVCLLTASKLRQCRPIGVDLLVYYTDHSVSAQDIRVWEMLLLSALQWDVCCVTAFDFVDHLLERMPECQRRNADVTSRIRASALTYITLCCTEMEFVRMRPSVVAAASVTAAINGHQGLTTSQTAQQTLAHLVNAEDLQEFQTLIHRMESLMTLQLSSVQQQQQTTTGSQQQQQQMAPIQQSKNKMASTASSVSSSGWESDTQPETPTDVQDIHF